LQPIRRPIALVYRRNRKRSRTVQAFIDMMASVYAAKTPVA
jgi:DNA-binding transcriptional LysR family regulator